MRPARRSGAATMRPSNAVASGSRRRATCAVGSTGEVTPCMRAAPSVSAAMATAAHASPRRRPVASQRTNATAGAPSSAAGGGVHAAAPISPASTPTVTTPSPARTSTTHLLRGRAENGPQVRASSSLICAASVSVMPGTAASSSALASPMRRRLPKRRSSARRRRGPTPAIASRRERSRARAHALEQEERARVGLQHHGVLPSRQEDALGPAAELARGRVALDALLGETDDLEARQAELGEHRARRPELAEAAVDHQQVR